MNIFLSPVTLYRILSEATLICHDYSFLKFENNWHNVYAIKLPYNIILYLNCLLKTKLSYGPVYTIKVFPVYSFFLTENRSINLNRVFCYLLACLRLKKCYASIDMCVCVYISFLTVTRILLLFM